MAARRLAGAVLRAANVAVAPPGGAGEVVKGFSLAIGPGEWVALTGENGSGKTTLALALAGLRPIRSGAIEVMGAPLGAGGATAARDHVAIVLQEPESQLLQPTVLEELAFASRNRGLPEPEIESRVRSRAARFGIAPDLERDPHTLSAGRQQILLIAAALIQEPRLLVLDEAGAHLDPGNRSIVLEVLREEAGRGLAILWVTQEREELAAADRILELGARPSIEVRRETSAARPPRRNGAPVRVELRIAPPRGDAGPRVAISEPMTLEVPAAGLLAVEGPNGCGKSVALAAVAGVHRIPQIETLWRLPPEPPPMFASQYPELQLFEERPEDEMLFAATSRGESPAIARRRAEEILEELGFEARIFAGRRTWDLSAGEKRVLQVAGALIAPASLWILDEPTAGLDARARVGLARVLARRSETGSILVASQDPEWLAGLGGNRVTFAPCKRFRTPSHGQKTD